MIFFFLVFVACSLAAGYAFVKVTRPAYGREDIPDDIIKEGASKKKLEALASSGGVDVIVIGSGVSGLTTASLLSRVGYKVLVLEQHDVAGGATHTFVDKRSFEHDVGLHYTGGRLDSFFSPLRRLWAVVSDGKLEWAPMDDTYDVAVNTETQERFDITHNHAANNAAMAEQFASKPGDAQSIAATSKAVRRYRWVCFAGRLAAFVIFGLKAFHPFVLRLVWPLVGWICTSFVARSTADVMRDICGIDYCVCSERSDCEGENGGGGAGKKESNAENTITNGGLAGCLTYMWGDYGTPPESSPFLMQAMLDDHYDGGGFMPRGGCATIAKTMTAAIRRCDGHVLVRAPVSAILTKPVLDGQRRSAKNDNHGAREGIAKDASYENQEDGVTRYQAIGVRCKDIDIFARVAVITSAGFRNTFGCADADARGESLDRKWGTSLLPAAVAASQRQLLQKPRRGDRKRVAAQQDRVGPSASMVYLFVGFDRSDIDLGLPARNVWKLASWNHDSEWQNFSGPSTDTGIDVNRSRLPGVFIGTASSKDPEYSHRNPGKATATVLAPVKFEWFQQWKDKKIKHRGSEYAALKQQWTDRLLNMLYEEYPQVKGHVEYTDLGTPLSNDYYLASVHGEVYGLEHVPERFNDLDAHLALHPRTTIDALYQTGQDVTSVGVPAAMLAGLVTTANISILAASRAVFEAVFS